MKEVFRSSEDYELFIYTITEHYLSIRRSTLTFVRRGASLAKVAGELHFDEEIRLVVLQRLVFHQLPMMIDGYGYEVWQSEEKLYWYDSQPHPDDPDLESSHPHHKHVQPDIKHNRIPAPDMSFNKPNLPFLIQEIEQRLGQAGMIQA